MRSDLRGVDRLAPSAGPSNAVAHRRERPQGAFSRPFVLPFRLDAGKTLNHARPDADKPRQITLSWSK